MASVKLGTLAIRTIAKPISERIKNYARSNQSFRTFCISLAQMLWRTEIRFRETLLGETHAAVRPLNDVKAIQNGATFLAEGFLFSVAAGLIIAETWRSSRSESKRREVVGDRIEELETRVNKLIDLVEGLGVTVETLSKDMQVENARNEELSRVLLRVVDIGIRGGWAEFEEHPVLLPAPRLDRLTGLSDLTKSDTIGTVPNISSMVQRIRSSQLDERSEGEASNSNGTKGSSSAN